MSGGEITIRVATSGDRDCIVGFLRAMAEETEGKRLDVEVLRAGAREALKDPSRCVYYLAEVDGAVVGQTMVTTEWSDWRNGFFWWIQSVYVEPGSRRIGVYRSLHDHIRSLARGRGDVCGLRLYVHRDNVGAMETYDSLGMSVTEYRLCEESW